MSLDVYLKGKRVGALHPGGGGDYSFAYLPEIVEEAGTGTPLLSCSLPVQAEPFGPAETRPFVEGLLPEGRRRERIAKELGIQDPDDGYSLIEALGGDCPGAVVFLPEGREMPSSEPDSLAWLDDDDLAEVICEEPDWLVDPNDERRMRFALPGTRHKLALVYDEEEDRWAWPEPGAPSTHIVKPEPDEPRGAAYNEMICSMAFREMGLPVAHAEVREIAGRQCLVSRRYDRWGEGRKVVALHQESFRQALGYSALDPVHADPGYAESRELLETISEEDGVEALFTASYCRFLMGNEENHGGNSALLFSRVGPILGPFHDVYAGTFHEIPAPVRPPGGAIGRNSCVIGLTPIAIECGYEPQPALELAVRVKANLCIALGDIAKRAYAEDWYEPFIDELLNRIIARFKSFREELKYLGPPSMEGPLQGEDGPF